jgi:hypothetical protein
MVWKRAKGSLTRLRGMRESARTSYSLEIKLSIITPLKTSAPEVVFSVNHCLISPLHAACPTPILPDDPRRTTYKTYSLVLYCPSLPDESDHGLDVRQLCDAIMPNHKHCHLSSI